MGIFDDLFPRRTKSLPRFDLMTAEEIVEFVGNKFTTARLGKYTKRDLIDAGWFDSFGPDLYDLGSTGGFYAINSNASGSVHMGNQLSLMSNMVLHPPTFFETDLSQPIYQQCQALHPKYGVVPLVVGGTGILADSPVVPAKTGFKGSFYVLGSISSITEAATVLEFEDEDNVDLEGNLAGGFTLNYTASTMNTQLSGAVFRGTVVSKTLEVDVSGFAAGGTILLYIIWWHEPV